MGRDHFGVVSSLPVLHTHMLVTWTTTQIQPQTTQFGQSMKLPQLEPLSGVGDEDEQASHRRFAFRSRWVFRDTDDRLAWGALAGSECGGCFGERLHSTDDRIEPSVPH